MDNNAKSSPTNQELMQFPRAKVVDSTPETAESLQLLTRYKQQQLYLQPVKKTTFTNHKMAL